jgi:transposase
MNKRIIRKYDKEFKLNAVSLLRSSRRSLKEMADELGIPAATLAGWDKEEKKSGKESFPGKGHIKGSDKELLELRKELAIAREERDILKKALGIFSSPKK